MMKKKVRRLREDELPELFKLYWLGRGRLNRKYEFYDIEGELYISDLEWDNPDLMHHWTQDACAGIGGYMYDKGIKEDRTKPYVTVEGYYLFECIPTDDYETSVREPNTGRMYVVCG